MASAGRPATNTALRAVSNTLVSRAEILAVVVTTSDLTLSVLPIRSAA